MRYSSRKLKLGSGRSRRCPFRSTWKSFGVWALLLTATSLRAADPLTTGCLVGGCLGSGVGFYFFCDYLAKRNAFWWACAGEDNFEKGNAAKALKCYDKALEKDAKFSRAYLGRAIARGRANHDYIGAFCDLRMGLSTYDADNTEHFSDWTPALGLMVEAVSDSGVRDAAIDFLGAMLDGYENFRQPLVGTRPELVSCEGFTSVLDACDRDARRKVVNLLMRLAGEGNSDAEVVLADERLSVDLVERLMKWPLRWLRIETSESLLARGGSGTHLKFTITQLPTPKTVFDNSGQILALQTLNFLGDRARRSGTLLQFVPALVEAASGKGADTLKALDSGLTAQITHARADNALKGLRFITGRDFGDDAAAWRAFSDTALRLEHPEGGGSERPFGTSRTDGSSADSVGSGGLGTTGVKAPSALRFDGLYLAYELFSLSDTRHYLRFYPDGTVLAVSSNGKPSQVAKWFCKPGDQTGHYTVSGSRVEFSGKSAMGIVDYKGTIDRTCLRLSTHSHINGNRDEGLYSFVRAILK